MRHSLALLLICALASDASAANPLALVLANSDSPSEIADPAASNAHEAEGEPAPEGELDAADLSKLGSRLAAIALTYESFRDAADNDPDSKLLVDYTSPRGLIPNPGDRAHTLDRVYRALALLDDTQALRYPEGEACARAHRLALLRSPDGLFADPETGELAPWLKAELKRSKANDAPGALIAASAREWTALRYLKTLAEARTLSAGLSDPGRRRRARRRAADSRIARRITGPACGRCSGRSFSRLRRESMRSWTIARPPGVPRLPPPSPSPQNLRRIR